MGFPKPAFAVADSLMIFVLELLGCTWLCRLLLCIWVHNGVFGRETASEEQMDAAIRNRDIGIQKANAGQQFEALSYLRQAVHFQPQHPARWSDLGVILMRLNRLVESRNAFEVASRIDPSHDLMENLRALEDAEKGLGVTRRPDQAKMHQVDMSAQRTATEEIPAVSDRPLEGAADSCLERGTSGWEDAHAPLFPLVHDPTFWDRQMELYEGRGVTHVTRVDSFVGASGTAVRGLAVTQNVVAHQTIMTIPRSELIYGGTVLTSAIGYVFEANSNISEDPKKTWMTDRHHLEAMLTLYVMWLVL